MSLVVTDAMLLAFLDEQLPPDQLAEVENLLRSDMSLQARMKQVLERENQGVHSLAAIWRRNRISCPDRERLGGYLLGVLKTAECEYIKFHLEEIGCQYCQSSVKDLIAEQTPDQQPTKETRRKRYFEAASGEGVKASKHGGRRSS